MAPTTLLPRWPMARGRAIERYGAMEVQRRKEEIKEGKKGNKKKICARDKRKGNVVCLFLYERPRGVLLTNDIKKYLFNFRL